jgi:hypothetical protein
MQEARDKASGGDDDLCGGWKRDKTRQRATDNEKRWLLGNLPLNAPAATTLLRSAARDDAAADSGSPEDGELERLILRHPL